LKDVTEEEKMYKKYSKYRFSLKNMENRQWPSKEITKAPIWCSVDLRDGNQALPTPMNVEKKMAYFNLLKDMGFKEIEVSFPSASQTDYDFVRKLIEEGHLGDDITIQVLTQSKPELIERTFEAIQGAKTAIVHLYNSTSVQQRKAVFKKDKDEITQIAIDGTKLIKEMAEKTDTKIIFEYSPESFTGTEPEYALEICEAVMDIWQPTPEDKMIINLPATVEMAMPNVYADQIEWFLRNVSRRDSILLSAHTHNDRGTAVAASEFALLAGADRIEGTLFGNGERTGNVDIVTLALNMISQGIDPGLNIIEMNKMIEIYENATEMKVPPRHPYAGELVYTAFSGSHQDAISKGLQLYNEGKEPFWDVPYLPIDPSDLGRQYEAIIRINSQSGKGGVAFVLENERGYKLPKAMHVEFGKIIKAESYAADRELTFDEIFDVFEKTYLFEDGAIQLNRYSIDSNGYVHIKASVTVEDAILSIEGEGNGPISAFFNAIKTIDNNNYSFEAYEEHALSSGSTAEAVSYIELKDGNESFFGVGKDKNTTTAALKAILSAINRKRK
jgi:2-isopropylmalate synthase